MYKFSLNKKTPEKEFLKLLFGWSFLIKI